MSDLKLIVLIGGAYEVIFVCLAIFHLSDFFIFLFTSQRERERERELTQ